MQQFVLDCPVKALNVGIVIWLSDSGMPMPALDVVSKVRPKLRTVIRLRTGSTDFCLSKPYV